MRKIHGIRGGRLAFLLLWIVSAVLLTFQLWLPEYRHSAAGVRAVRLVICAQVAAALGFHVLACIRRDFLGTFNAFLRRHKLLTAQASLLFMSALLFICGLISLAGSAGIEDAFNLAALGRRSFLTLSALYLMGRGLPDRTISSAYRIKGIIAEAEPTLRKKHPATASADAKRLFFTVIIAYLAK